MFDVVSGYPMLSIQLANASEYCLDSMVNQILDADVVREWEAGRAVWDWEINTAIKEKSHTRTPVCLVSSDTKEHVQLVFTKVAGCRKETMITNSESCVVSK